jgi:hypothetical protein
LQVREAIDQRNPPNLRPPRERRPLPIGAARAERWAAITKTEPRPHDDATSPKNETRAPSPGWNAE